jgi:carbon-monoxide dehydrogenase large subunit
VTGKGGYLSNRVFDGALWLVPVRSPIPHGDILSIDLDDARDLPGVVAIYTGQDITARMPVDASGAPEAARRPLITPDRVRFVGDIVAVVVAEDERTAREAADLVWVDIDPLRAVPDIDAARADNAPVLFPDHGSNVVLDGGIDFDDTENVLAGSDVVVRATIDHQRLAAVPLEPNAAVAVPREDGGVDFWVGSQNVFNHRNKISHALDIDSETLTVRVPDMGGGFGAKIYAYPEQALVLATAMRLGRPVRWAEHRTENMLAMTQGRAPRHEAAIGATRDGKIVGLRVRLTQDAGAYPLFGAALPTMTQRVISGPYRIPLIDYRWSSVVTNTAPVHAYRGAGRPEAAATLERLMDLLADELGMDRVELRRINAFRSDEFPLVTAANERYDSGDYAAALDLALETAGIDELREEQRARRDRGDRLQLGIGVSLYTEVTAGLGRREWGRVEVHEDGSATAYSGSSSHGQGHETTFPQVVSAVLGIPADRISLVQGDTSQVVRGTGTMGSKSLQMGGSTLFHTATIVLEKAKAIVARRLEADPADVVVLPTGGLGIAGVPGTEMDWGAIARLASDPASLPPGMEPGLDAADNWVQDEATFPFGAHVSVVEVDTETGEIRLLRHIACDDCGTIFNHVVVDGQVHGGVAQGVGQALTEVVRYDEDGNPLSGNLTSYLLPTATTVPRVEIAHTETPTGENPLGVKGIGESATIGSTPAVVSAVHDALAPFGVKDLQMPLTPLAVWSALQAARSEV